MSKLSLFLLIATLAYCTASSSFDSDDFFNDDSDDCSDDDSDADDWVIRMPKMKMPKMPKIHFEPIVMPTMPKIKPINPEEIRNLKPDGPNSIVNGFSTSHKSSVKYINGKKVEDSHSADMILNQNGKVQEYHDSNQ